MTQSLPSFAVAAKRLLAVVCVALTAAALWGGGISAQEPESPAAQKPAADDPKLEPQKPEPSKSDDKKPDDKKSDEKKPAAETGDEPKTSERPADVLKAAREKLMSYRSIKAKIVETVALGNRRFKAEGTYQQGSNLKLRLEFKVKSGETEGSLLEVCDGQVLWTRYTVGESSRITRRDVREIIEAVNAASDRRLTESMLRADIGLGGLPALMGSVEANMTFRSVRQEEIDGQAFTVLDGIWSKTFMDEFKKASPKSDRLPDHIPDSLRLYLDTATLLPRRFLYLKRDADTKQNRPMVTVDFVDLVLNAPISEDEFFFIPPDGTQPDDITKQFIEQNLGIRAQKAK